MLADYRGIHSEALFYVPLEGEHEVWQLSVTNRSARQRELTLTGYAEFTNNGNYEQDQVNLQYSQFITRTLFDGIRTDGSRVVRELLRTRVAPPHLHIVRTQIVLTFAL